MVNNFHILIQQVARIHQQKELDIAPFTVEQQSLSEMTMKKTKHTPTQHTMTNLDL